MAACLTASRPHVVLSLCSVCLWLTGCLVHCTTEFCLIRSLNALSACPHVVVSQQCCLTACFPHCLTISLVHRLTRCLTPSLPDWHSAVFAWLTGCLVQCLTAFCLIGSLLHCLVASLSHSLPTSVTGPLSNWLAGRDLEAELRASHAENQRIKRALAKEVQPGLLPPLMRTLLLLPPL